MENEITILEGYSDMEKGAYLGAMASLTTADRIATPEELQYIDALISAAHISEEQANLIRHAANTEIPQDDLMQFLETLKGSELRFSLVSDVIAFAQADQDYSDEEKQKVKLIADYLGVNQEQFSLLNQFTKQAVKEAPAQMQAIESEQTTPKGFLDSLGFGDKLKSAGINKNALLTGALAIIGPMILSKMMRGRNSGNNSGGGGLGGLLGGLMGAAGGSMLGGAKGGGLLGGLGGLMGGSGSSGGGGLLGSLLGGSKGSGGGGLLGKIFGR